MSRRVIAAGDQTFTPRKETYAVILAREEQAAREGDLRDIVNGYATRITHANQRMVDLADADGDFDVSALEAIQAELHDLRGQHHTASTELFIFRLGLLAQRLDPTPDVQLLLDHWGDEDYEAAMEILDARPTSRTPTD